MKRFSIPIRAFVQAFVLTLIVSACGTPQVAPADSLKNRQATAIAAVVTVLAETQAAIPTATSLPPTVVPTNTLAATLPPVPTLGNLITATPGLMPATETAVVDPCINTLLPDSLTGEKIKIRIDNPTKASINVSVYLQQSSPQNVCGYRGYAVAAQGSLVINNLVEGCYSLWAWNPDPKNYFMVTNGTSCLNNSKDWVFDVSTNSIKLRE